MPVTYSDHSKLPDFAVVDIFTRMLTKRRFRFPSIMEPNSKRTDQPLHARLKIDLSSDSEKENNRVAYEVLWSWLQQQHLLIKVSPNPLNVDRANRIVTHFQGSVRSMWYGADDPVVMGRDELSGLLSQLGHVETLHMDAVILTECVPMRGQVVPIRPLRNLRTVTFTNSSLEMPWLNWKELLPNVEQLAFPLISSSNVFLQLAAHYSRQLKSLGLVFGSSTLPYLQHLAFQTFPRLRRLILVHHWQYVWQQQTIDLVVELFKKLRNIKELYLGYWIVPKIMNTIFHHCPQLTSVTLNTFHSPELHVDVLYMFSTLRNLKHLRLEQITLTLPMLEKCGEFRRLESLDLLSVFLINEKLQSQIIARLAQVMPVLRSLVIAPLCDEEAVNPVSLFTLREVSLHMRTLRRLTVIEKNNGQEVIDMIDLYNLYNLPELRELELNVERFTFCPQDSIVPDFLKSLNIRRLVLQVKEYDCGAWLMTRREMLSFLLFKIKDYFPNLTDFEVTNTLDCTQQDLEFIRRSMGPQVRMNFRKPSILVDRSINEYLQRCDLHCWNWDTQPFLLPALDPSKRFSNHTRYRYGRYKRYDELEEEEEDGEEETEEE